MNAGQIDRSWYAKPGSGPGAFHVLVDGAPACNRRAFAIKATAMPAENVPNSIRCQRPGCRQRWPEEYPR